MVKQFMKLMELIIPNHSILEIGNPVVALYPLIIQINICKYVLPLDHTCVVLAKNKLKHEY